MTQQSPKLSTQKQALTLLNSLVRTAPLLVLSALLYAHLTIHCQWIEIELIKKSISHFL